MNGQKVNESNWKDGIENGKWTEWWVNGQKFEEGTYKDGKADGLWSTWRENGQKWERVEWNMGENVGWMSWDENGQKVDRFTTKGRNIRLYTTWYPNGQKQFEANVDDNDEYFSKQCWDEMGDDCECHDIQERCKISTELYSTIDSISYSIGVDIGKNMKTQELELNKKALFEGWRLAFNGEDLKLTDEDMLSVLNSFRKELQEKSQQKAKAQAVENLSKGEAFLAENAQKEGVVSTESGLQYKVVNQGDGPIPTIKDKVTVHYRGTLIDGEEFDSSYKRGQPTSFPVTGVIKGWTEALQLMPVGSKWELFIPSNLAYGNSPRSPGGPNSSLVFEVELLGIE